ncbi:hypothetical protein [Corynebacterium sp. HMSC034B08]|uniref:hypothetical protein n=1 Tax=Corynebacterium sp. HMSC034B08 TaxID=1715135 RepID=UPI000AE8C94D|nr:hypothetical protein [Corynebacterium sp. HMSC034B08]
MTKPFDQWKVVHAQSDPAAVLGLERLRYLSHGYAIPAFFSPNKDYPNRLLVLLNGAVERTEDRDPREVFQRRSWVDRLDANVLIMSDATIHPGNSLRIGWAQGNGTSALEQAMAECVDYFRRYLQIENENILFFGSSAGGYQAIALHSRFNGSRFVVNNAQFDWTRYYQSYVDKVLAHSFDSISVESARRDFPMRCNVLERFLDSNSSIKGTYWLNIASSIDYKAQLPVLNAFMVRRAARQPNTPMDISVDFYADKRAGHMPRGKEHTVGRINRALLEIDRS